MVKNIQIQDSYGVRYEVTYISKNVGGSNIVDVTTKVYDPKVFGSDPAGYISNNKLFMKGIVSITRQIFKIEEDGYTIVAEGGTSVVTDKESDYIQVSGIIQSGSFLHNYNNRVLADCESSIDSGSALVDIDDTLNSCVWADVDVDGSFLPSSSTALEFTDIW